MATTARGRKTVLDAPDTSAAGRTPNSPTKSSAARPDLHHQIDSGARAAAILQLLRDAGGRITASRRAVLDALMTAGDHPTAEDLAIHVQKTHPDVAVSTIYRTLEHLEEIGVLVHVHLGHGPAVYHFADDAHAHLVCRLCGRSAPLSADVTRSLARGIETASGFHAELAHFSITGLCASCNRSRAR